MYELRLTTIGGTKIITFWNSREEVLKKARELCPNLLMTGFQDRIATGILIDKLGVLCQIDVTRVNKP